MYQRYSAKRFLGLILLVAMMASLVPAQAASYATIRPGDRGDNVRQMQKALDFVGISLVDDGIFGNMTTQAVKLFQERMRLTQDGLAGNRTLCALYELAPQYKPQSQGSDQPAPTEEAAAVPAPETHYTQGSATVYIPNGGSLNLRRTASRGQNTFYQIPNGTVLKVLGITGTWVRVDAGGRVGYVQQDFLRMGNAPIPESAENPEENPAPTASPQPAAPATGSARVYTANRGSLNLRRTASSGNNVIYQIPFGTIVGILHTSGQWAQVEAEGRTGYVVASFLQPADSAPTGAPKAEVTPAPTTPPPANNTGGTAVIHTQNGGVLNQRAEARTGKNIIGTIPSGSHVTVLSQGATWCQVSYQGRDGWVMTSFLRFNTAPATPTPEPSAEASPTPEPSDTPAPAFARILRAGDKGDDVRLMQEKLKALMYDCEVNGSFDDQTLAAFKRFQSLNGLTIDGVLGSLSSGVLLSTAARDADSAPLTYTSLSLDSVDGDLKLVSALQQALNDLDYPLSVDGRFETKTHQAVVNFQQINGLPATGVADSLMQSKLFSGAAKRYDASAISVDTGGATGGGPSSGQVKLLHWYDDVKKSASSGQRANVYHPASGLSFTLRFYSMGAHADSESLTLRDTQLMNKAFGPASWNINIVYVKLPDGRWTMASMHNRPHLSGSIRDNGFDGHLCVHFLRDLDEVTRNSPGYGLDNQKAIRKGWENLTGETID
ncbi:MAG: peptidoglycan-binding protein [Eubacteriales bacterium]|nr:peptidoglycan-binding protein [Eubacteriales bacterium]